LERFHQVEAISSTGWSRLKPAWDCDTALYYGLYSQKEEAHLIDAILRKTLIRNFYFAEALAVYERFYRPLISTYAPARKELADRGRHDDRPPTWVPLVFHCTTEDHLKQIFAEGILKPGSGGTVSFTEIPIGELDRMKYRHHDAEQVAIGFPRRYIQSLGLTPVWYLAGT
jgi:hypothetical protein